MAIDSANVGLEYQPILLLVTISTGGAKMNALLLNIL